MFFDEISGKEAEPETSLPEYGHGQNSLNLG